MDNQNAAKKIKALRGERSQKEVAAAVGISISALGMYETGKRVPKDSIKKRLAAYFQTTVEDIFFAE
jgi:DNA-binding XRE family transcriptional regulator